MGSRASVRVAVALIAALAVSALPARVSAQEPLGERVVRITLVKAADQLAGAGRAAPARELLDVAAALGHPEKDVARALTGVEKKLAKAKRVGSATAAVKSLRKALAGLTNALADTDGETRETLARLTLRLDGDHTAAREALGHVQRPEGWAEPELVPLLERRAAIRLAIEEARRLEVPVTFGEGGSEILAKITGAKVRRATWGKVHVQATHLDDHKLARVLRNTVRAAAVSNYALRGELLLPELLRDCRVSVFPGKPEFQQGVREAVALGRLPRGEGDVALQSESWLVNGGERLMAPLTEAGTSTWLLCDVIRERWYSDRPAIPQASLEVGHQNWAARTFLGAGVTYAGVVTRGERPGGATSDDGGRARAPEEMWRLADAGIAGSRSWMRYLVANGEDPAWSRSFVDQQAKVQGDDLLKATFVVEYLQEAGTLLDIMKKTTSKRPEAATFEEAIGGGSLAEFEERWRRWIAFPAAGGLLQQLAAGSDEDEDPADRAVLDHLDALRSLAIDEAGRQTLLPLGMDPELSAGCRAHAAYLEVNPAQLAAWPDAHEEWPDRERFSVEGSWSGQHSVVVGGVKNGRAAIDAWMGTFYHRVPLLDPGLVRIGYGYQAGIAVLDTNSMVAPFGWRSWVGWPAANSKGVPRTFNPELPNPVPGADQSTWGYPVTFQIFAAGPAVDVTIELHQGDADGDVVDCHVSTPTRPTNPELAPDDTWCLIPKAHLKPRTKYTVVARNVPLQGHANVQWSFTTGK